jgi:hypothetical protein
MKVADSKQVGGGSGHRADNARQGKAALVHHRLVRWKWNRVGRAIELRGVLV